LDRAYLKHQGRGEPPPRSGFPALVAVIVTYKSHALLDKCLASVAEHLPELPVYVYENSGDGYPGREALAARHPGVHWVFGPVNVGFAAAPEQLIVAAPDCVLLTFPDLYEEVRRSYPQLDGRWSVDAGPMEAAPTAGEGTAR
jgi:hypothetical protein